MTADHLRPILESEADTAALARMAIARADIPPPILTALRMGQLTALQKPTGGVRGIVTGEVFRHLVARSIAQQLARSTSFPGGQCWMASCSRWREETQPFLLSASSTEHFHNICGRMMMVLSTSSTRVKAANKATLSCPCSSRLGSTRPCVPSNISSAVMNACLHTLTTFTSFVLPNVWALFMHGSRWICRSLLASKSIWATLKPGTEAGIILQDALSCKQQHKLLTPMHGCGAEMVSLRFRGCACWDPHWQPCVRAFRAAQEVCLALSLA